MPPHSDSDPFCRPDDEPGSLSSGHVTRGATGPEMIHEIRYIPHPRVRLGELAYSHHRDFTWGMLANRVR